MRSLVVGYGSIGERHSRILKELGNEVAVVSKREIDFTPCYDSLEDAISRFDPEVIVIANKTFEHFDTLLMLTEIGFKGKILIEKPLFSKIEEIPVDLEDVYVGYNLRFHPIMVSLKELLKGKKIISTQVYVGQYLPNWRPNVDYRQSYSSFKKEGGGVLLDLSHELDYTLWLCGQWEQVTAIGGKYSDLEIESDDIFTILMQTTECPMVFVQMNYLDRKTRREIIINTNEQTIKADLVQGTIEINDEIQKIPTQRDDTYRKQLLAMNGEDQDKLCTLNQGLQVMKLIENIEKAACLRRWIKNE